MCVDAEESGGGGELRSGEVMPPVQNQKERHLWVSWTLSSVTRMLGLGGWSRGLAGTRSRKFQALATVHLQPSAQLPAKQEPVGAHRTRIRGGSECGNKRWSLRAGAPSTGAGHINGSQGCQFPFSLEWLVLSNPEALFKG